MNASLTPNISVIRLVTAISAAALCLLAVAPTAIADPKFSGGQLQLPTYGPVDRHIQECAFNERGIQIAGQFGKSPDGTGKPWRRGNRLATLSLPTSPTTRRGTAIGRWNKQRIPSGEIVFGTEFDSAGRLYYVTGKSVLRGTNRKLHVLRTTPSGKPDRGFGIRGMITLTGVGRAVRNHSSLWARIVPAGSRPLIVLTNRQRTEVHRVDRKGVDRAWTPYRVNLGVADTVTAASGGSVIVGATPVVNGQAQPGMGLTRLLPTGRVDKSFGVDGVWDAPRIEDAAFPPPNPPQSWKSVLGRPEAAVSTPAGGLLVAVANVYNDLTFTHSVYRLVEVDSIGKTVAVSAPKGTSSVGGDTGFPLSSPFHFGPSKHGANLAAAEGWFFGTEAATYGFTASSSANPGQSLEQKGIAVTAFASSASSTKLLACGTLAHSAKGVVRERVLGLRMTAVR